MFRKKKYKFTDKRHSRLGLLSGGIGMLAFFVLCGCLMYAYMESGQAGKEVAVAGALSFLLALAGLCFGLCGMAQEDVYGLFPRLGCAVNGFLLVAFVSVYALGW